jgi:hypothetical protein
VLRGLETEKENSHTKTLKAQTSTQYDIYGNYN